MQQNAPGAIARTRISSGAGFFTTADLTAGQWPACAAIGSAVLWVGVILKLLLRHR